MKAFLLRLGKRQGCLLSSLSLNIVRKILTRAKGQETEIKDINTEKEEIKVTLLADDMIVHIKVLKNLKLTLY